MMPLGSRLRRQGIERAQYGQWAQMAKLIMAQLWHRGTIAPRALKKEKTNVGKCPKVNLSFESALRAKGASAHAGNIGNSYSFAHANYGANP